MQYTEEKRGVEKAEADMQRMAFATNPEWWQKVYGEPAMGSGAYIREPTTEEEFEEMLREWQGDGFTPLNEP